MKDGLPGAFGIRPEKSRSTAMNVKIDEPWRKEKIGGV
jgi:hypothetical protein